jgi:hypothetical protein
MKYKKFKITPNLCNEFQIMWGDFKKMRQKTKKNPRVPSLTLGEETLPRVLEEGSRGRVFLKYLHFSITFRPRVPLVFPECLSSPSTMDYKALGEASLPRVHFFPSVPRVHFFPSAINSNKL